MIRYDRLLVAVDGSDGSNTAARHAVALAAEADATVDVVHVVERSRLGDAAGGADHRDVLEDRGRHFLGDVERLAESAGVEVTVALDTGTPHEAILDRARERGVHLVVMGRHGAGTVGERLLGGVTERVLRHGTLPVLSAWADGGDDVGIVGAAEVLLPTDGSDPAERAAEHAATVAALAGARVHVVAVADVGDAGRGSERATNLEERSRAATERLAGSVESAAGVPVRTAVRRGQPAEALADYAASEAVDAVVMGASGRSGVERVLLGSVTERLLATLDVPMLVVPGGR